MTSIKMNKHTLTTNLAPCAYETEKINLDKSPRYSFGSKIIHDRPNNNPAPGAYQPENVKIDHSPAYTFGSRFNHDKPNNNPGK